jgi:3-oxoacyl-[acyl-carrier-protein] synthase-3
MYRSRIKGIAHYVPEKRVSNENLTQYMDTSDEWIQERTGIRERRYAEKFKETTATMGALASQKALEMAGVDKNEVDFIIFCTLSPDYYFPGSGVLMQREMGITKTEIGALDIRNQCSGFVYGLSVADQFIKSGMYKNILLVGSEMHSMGLDYSTRGRNVTVLFGDGAGAALIGRAEEEDKSEVLSTHLHSDGTHAEKLSFINPGSHGGYHFNKSGKETDFGFSDSPTETIFMNKHMVENAQIYPEMDGPFVFKMAIQKFPEVIMEALKSNGISPEELKLLIPHQANLRISQFVQNTLKLKDDQVYNNIQRYGNTTAASIPIALSEALSEGRVNRGDLVCLAAFGSGFTWASALLRW